MRLHKAWLIALSILGLLAFTGCGLTKEGKIEKHLQNGDKYFSQQKYNEAIIEYKNVLKLDPANAGAIKGLGVSLYAAGNVQDAFPLLKKASEAAPDDLDIRLKLATIYLMGGKLEEAGKNAEFVLSKDPKNFDALLLEAGMADSPEKARKSLDKLQALQSDFDSRYKYHLALGALYQRLDNTGKAEEQYKQALQKDPKAGEAYVALGNLYVQTKRLDEAEKIYADGVKVAPDDLNTAMRLTELYLLTRKTEEAKKLLDDLSKRFTDNTAVLFKQAQIALAEKRYDDSLQAIDAILRKTPNQSDALTFKSQILMAQGKTEEAIENLKEVVKIYPTLPQARNNLAMAYWQVGKVLDAKAELKEALRVNPNYAEATLRLAEMDLRSGDPKEAIERLEKFTAVEENKSNAQGWFLLGSAYMADKDFAKASATFERLAGMVPQDPRPLYFWGLSLKAQNKPALARQQFEAALGKAPHYMDALAQIITFDLADKKFDTAIERINAQIAKAPDNPRYQYLLGRVYLLKGDKEKAEQSLDKAIQLDPELTPAYNALAMLYVQSGRQQEAMKKLDKALEVNPKNLGAVMLKATIYLERGDIPESQKQYERALELNPKFAPAANNLAYIYSEHGGDLEKAFKLAMMARDAAPEDPSIADTLGWIIYKRGDAKWARSLIGETAAKMPENAEVLYHLGMVQLKLGEKDSARQTLQKVLDLDPKFAKADEVRKTLVENK